MLSNADFKVVNFVKSFIFLFAILSASFSFAQSASPIKILLVGDSITDGTIGSTDGLGYRNDLYDDLSSLSINFDFVGSSGSEPYEGFYYSGDLIADFYSGGYGNGSFDIANDMSTYTPEMVLVHLGTNDIGSDLSKLVPYSNDYGQTLNNTASGRIVQFIKYLLRWKNGTNGTFLKRILISQIIPKVGYSDGVNAFNAELATILNDCNNDRIPGIPPGSITLVDQNTSFNVSTMMYSDGIHPNDIGYANIASNYASAINNILKMVDDFNRVSLGNDWSAGSEFTIINNELSNTSTDDSWGHMAVYTAQVNPVEVSFKWGANASSNGITNGGFAVMLDGPSNKANGYLVWQNGNTIDLWTRSEEHTSELQSH